MNINNKKYVLQDSNYYPEISEKKQIVIGNTFSSDMKHFIGWSNRLCGRHKRGSHFTVDKSGKIYQHFDTNYHSDFLPNNVYSKSIISISLVNEGWLEIDIKDKSYFNVNGITYNQVDGISEKRWRSFNVWTKYTKEQLDSTIFLVDHICNKENISKNVISHNTQIKEIDLHNFSGVLYRSNWIKNATDLNPTWNFTDFKQLIEG